MTPEAVMIFAAGLGTRMGALTRDRPKPLIEVAGRPLIDHALALARAAGIPRIVVNTHAHADQMQAHLARVAPGARISHEPVLLETGGGLKRALPLLGPGPVFTLNADMVWTGPNPLAALAAAWTGTGALLCLVPRASGHRPRRPRRLLPRPRRPPPPPRRRRRRALRLCRRPDHRPRRARRVAEDVFSLNPVWDALLARGDLRGIVHPGGWVDVGRPEGIALAEADAGRMTRLFPPPPARASSPSPPASISPARSPPASTPASPASRPRRWPASRSGRTPAAPPARSPRSSPKAPRAFSPASAW